MSYYVVVFVMAVAVANLLGNLILQDSYSWVAIAFKNLTIIGLGAMWLMKQS